MLQLIVMLPFVALINPGTPSKTMPAPPTPPLLVKSNVWLLGESFSIVLEPPITEKAIALPTKSKEAALELNVTETTGNPAPKSWLGEVLLLPWHWISSSHTGGGPFR